MNIPGRKVFQGEELLSDWTDRQGEGLVLRAQMIEIGPDVGLDVEIQVWTKNAEDAGDGSAIENSSAPLKLSLTGDGNTSVQQLIIEPNSTPAKGIKEKVRLQIKGVNSLNDDAWMRMRVFPLIWFDGAR